MYASKTSNSFPFRFTASLSGTERNFLIAFTLDLICETVLPIFNELTLSPHFENLAAKSCLFLSLYYPPRRHERTADVPRVDRARLGTTCDAARVVSFRHSSPISRFISKTFLRVSVGSMGTDTQQERYYASQ